MPIAPISSENRPLVAAATLCDAYCKSLVKKSEPDIQRHFVVPASAADTPVFT